MIIKTMITKKLIHIRIITNFLIFIIQTYIMLIKIKKSFPEILYIIHNYSRMQPQLFIPSYLKNTYLFSLTTKIANIQDNKVLFEDTIFHPQGGGQPKDKGWVQAFLASENPQKLEILNATVNKETGQIWNQLSKVEGLKIGDQINIKIDEGVRRKHAKLHSAGHLLDLAVQNLGFGWETAKGYHFEDGPYVEYKGPNQNLEQKAGLINNEIKKILASNIATIKEHYGYEEAVNKGLIPKQFKTPLIRIIKFEKNDCPCGGTHIENTNQIQKLQVTKLQKKGKFLRANYIVQ